MAEGDVTREIRIRWVAENQGFIQAAQQNDNFIVKMREQLLSLSQAGKVSFTELAANMQKAFKSVKMDELKQTISQINSSLQMDSGEKVAAIKEARRQINEQIREYNRLLKEAVKGLGEYSNAAKQSAEGEIVAEQQKQAARKATIAAQKEYVQAMASGNQVVSEGAQKEGQILTALAAKIKEVAQASKTSYAQAAQGMVGTAPGQYDAGTVNNALKLVQLQNQGAQGATTFATALKGLNSIASVFFGVTLANLAQQAMSMIIGYFKQATEAAYDYTKAIFQLSAGVRAAQRSGMDTSMASMYENISKIQKEFKVFSFPELVKGTSDLVNLTRDLNLTEKQLMDTQRAAATLAVINGRAMDDVQRTMALALSSGYTEGLQRLGVSINRVTTAEKAAEMGWKGGYTALTEYQRSQATLALISEKTAKYQNDLAEYYKTLPGIIDSATAAQKNATASLGTALVPLKTLWESLKAIELQFLRIHPVFVVFGGVLYGLGEAVMFVNDAFSILSSNESISKKLSDLITRFKDLAYYLQAIADAVLTKGFAGLDEFWTKRNSLGDESIATVENQAEAEQELVQTIESAADEIADITQDEVNQREDLLRDLQRDLEDIERDGARKREEIEREYAQKVAEINLNLQRDLAAAYRDYQYALQELDADIAAKRQQIEQDYANKILEIQEDLQKKLHRLREEYIFDIDEAIRGGDVRQVRKLMRQYQFDKHKIIEDQKDATQEAKNEYEQQLADLKRYEAQKRQELLISYQQKIYDIRLNFQQQMEEANIEHQQQIEDLKRSMEEERQERLRQYNQQLQDLRISIDRRLRMVADGLRKEIAYTDEAMKRIYDSMVAYLGPNGYIDQVLKYYQQNLGTAVTGASTPPSSATSFSVPGFATGGTMIATKPTLAMFGERGAEMATFTPLNGSQSVGGNATLRISLSPGLEAAIVENSLKEFSKILVSVERSR